jgi:cytochrome oxidase assembly protein ShyY1
LHTKIVLVYRGYVSTAQAATATETRTSSTVELRGDVLEVLQALLAEGRSNEVVALVTKLVSRNSELEKRLAQVLSGG